MDWYLTLIKFISEDDSITVGPISFPMSKTMQLEVHCKKYNHDISRPARDVLENMHKNDGSFSCYLCRQQDGTVKGTRAEEESKYINATAVKDKTTLMTDEIGEQWIGLIVNGDNKTYAVSNRGKVKNVKENKILGFDTSSTYARVILSLGSRSTKTRFHVHELVAIGFLNEEDKQYSINHIDGNRFNNNVENLEWATMKDNVRAKTNFSRVKKNLAPIEEEQWKRLEKHGKVFILSNFGRIKTEGRITTGSKSVGNKYHRHGGYRVSRLVAEAFCALPPGPIDNYVVNHIDNNQDNNYADNLEWTTHSQNAYHAKGCETDTHCRAVEQILNSKVIARYPSIAKAAEITKINEGAINAMLLGASASSGGFTWEYIDTDEKIDVWQDPTVPPEDFIGKEQKHVDQKVVVRAILNEDGSMGETIKEYESLVAATRDDQYTAIAPTTLKRILTGENKQRGYFWTYKDPKIAKDTEASATKKAVGFGVMKINAETGQVAQTFKSLKETSRETGIKDTKLRTLTRNGKVVDGFRYEVCE